MDAVDKIQELMETGEFRDPIAEREAKEAQEAEAAPQEEATAEASQGEDDIAFDDL